MPYTQLFYHLVWGTKGRQALLTAEVEPIVHNLVRNKASALGATVFALGGVEDHVHLVASVPPVISIAKFVGQVKGSSSAVFNKSGFTRQRFYWQDEYGAFSFDRKRLPNFVAYAERQKEHHARRTAIRILERTATSSELREPEAIYAVEAEGWRRELLALE
ncbi:MAG: IS200/IS605 family transposase [bacterium]|nr:IS200/IS605 family transposase [bacterium]